MEVAAADDSKQTGFNGPNRPYYIAVIVVTVLALGLGLGLGLGLKKSSSRTLISIPPLQPPVTASVPSALRPSNAAWVTTQSVADGRSPSLLSLQSMISGASASRVGLQALNDTTSLDQVKSRLFGPGPTDFVTRLGAIDTRIQEFATRNLEGNGRVCVGEAAQLWTPNFLPAGVSFPMWLSCKEEMTNSPANLKVFFGTRGATSYVAEVQYPSTTGNGAPPRMAVLAAVSNNGTQVEAWQVISEPTTVAYFQIRADRTAQSVEVSFASTQGHALDIGCGVRMRTSPTLTYASGEFRDTSFAASVPCSGASYSVCAASTTLASASGQCGAISTFSTTNLTQSTLTSLISVAGASLQLPAGSMPTLTSFTVAA